MVALITDRHLERSLIRRRHAWGADKYDEVWDGIYIMNAMPNNEHQGLVAQLSHILQTVVVDAGHGRVFPGCNISDRAKGWRQNYRVPDVAVFLNGTQAIDKGAYWLGGPDLAIEIVSPRDRSRKKLDFYAGIGTRELLLLDRKPWSLELYKLADGVLTLSGKSSVQEPAVLESTAVQLAWQLLPSAGRPIIQVGKTDGSQHWEA